MRHIVYNVTTDLHYAKLFVTFHCDTCSSDGFNFYTRCDDCLVPDDTMFKIIQEWSRMTMRAIRQSSPDNAFVRSSPAIDKQLCKEKKIKTLSSVVKRLLLNKYQPVKRTTI